MQHPLFNDVRINNNPTPNEPSKPKKRQKEDLRKAKEALTAFRFLAASRYLPRTSFTASVVFHDRLLNALAANVDISTLQDLEEVAKMKWVFGSRRVPSEEVPVVEESGGALAMPTLFEKALALVRKLDQEKEEGKNAAKRARLEKVQGEKARKQAAAEEVARQKREREQAKREAQAAAALEKQQLEEEEEAEQRALGYSQFQSSSSPALWGSPTEAPLTFNYNVSFLFRLSNIEGLTDLNIGSSSYQYLYQIRQHQSPNRAANERRGKKMTHRQT